VADLGGVTASPPRWSVQRMYSYLYHVGNIDVAMAAQSRWFGMRQISIVDVWGQGPIRSGKIEDG
jgi:hypothetical protein